MNLFLKKTFFFFSLLAIGILLLGVDLKQKTASDFLSAVIDKHQRLDQSQGPRIILTGGSNVSFGIDSEMIEREFRRPVTNLSLQANLGLNFMLNELKEKMREGDTLYISTEYFLGLEGEPRSIAEVYKYLSCETCERSLSPLVKIQNKANEIISHIRLFISSVMIQLFGDDLEIGDLQIYQRKSFNKYGDMIAHLGLKTKIPPPSGPIVYSYYKGIEAMNEFYLEALAKKVRVFYSFPTFSKSSFLKNTKTLYSYQQDFKRDLKIPLLHRIDDVIYDDNLYSDSIYHLNEAGRKLRTKDLIKFMKFPHPP